MAANDEEERSWPEWQYRHDLFFKMQFKYAGGIAAICSLPFLKADAYCKYGIDPKIFAALALTLGIFGVIHLVLEYARVVELRTQLNVFPESRKGTKFEKNHPIYHAIRTKIPFDWAMWPLTTIVLLGFPAVVWLFANCLISCPIAD